MSILVIYAAIFVSALVFFDWLIRLLVSKRQSASFVNDRLRALEGEVDRKKAYTKILTERGVNYSQYDDISNHAKTYFSQSGVVVSRSKTRLIGLAIPVFVFMACFYFSRSILLTIPITALGSVLISVALVARARRIRIKKFVAQLPMAIDVMVRSLAAGHPVPTSISLVAREMSDPIGSEFGIMNDEMTYGTDIDIAVRNMVKRVGAEELNLLAISLSVQKGTGGNLGEILSNLADVLRGRSLLKQKIRAISAEGRMTSWVMLVFPFGLYFMISAISPSYFDPLWQSGYGTHFLTGGFVMLLFGMMILRRIVKFEI